MAVDLSVFGRQKTVMDIQQMQEAFQLQKQLQALQVGSALSTAANGGITPKDLINFQMQAQNHADNLDLRRDQMAQTKALAEMSLGDRQNQYQDKKQEKIQMKMANDQNALTGITTGIDQQIQDLDQLIGVYDDKGNLVKPGDPGLAGNFGIRGAIPNAPGSDSSNAKVLLDKIRAGSFIGGLNQLKQQSATGASGLGAVSEVEGAKVQNAQAALQSAQDLPSLIKNARIYRQRLLESKGNLVKGFNNVYAPYMDNGGGQPSGGGNGGGNVSWDQLK